MDVIYLVLIFLVGVVLSSYLTRSLPVAIPLPLVQIGMGMLLAAFTDLGVDLSPDIFFLLFLPPLLFLDGWRIPKQGLFRDIGTIAQLAFGLVIFTVIGMGFFIHFLIPLIPLEISFALAAIISPTDPVAVSAIAQRINVPKRLLHILEGESLLNDATGLVCMRLAVAAAMTGSFSVVEAAGTFFWLAMGGLTTGVVVTLIVVRAKNWITKKLGEQTGIQILISVLIPFGAYLAAEQIGASGLMSAVSAGMAMSYAELSGRALASTRIERTAVWDMLGYSLNGAMFILLGEQFPAIAKSAAELVWETGHRQPAWLIVYILAIMIALIALRFIWVWVSLKVTLYRSSHGGPKHERQNWRVTWATVIAGARGAITLAGILTLPLHLTDGSILPARDLAILLAAGVIIFSLILASVGLPILLKDLEMPSTDIVNREEDHMRITAAQAAIRAVEAAQYEKHAGGGTAEQYAIAAARVMERYRSIINIASQERNDPSQAVAISEIEKELWLKALQTEREVFSRALERNRLSQETARKIIRQIDLIEARVTGS